MNPWGYVGIGLICAVAVGCSSQAESSEPDAFTVTGSVALMDPSGFNYESVGKKGEACWAEGGYSDIAEGARVVVRGGDGTKVALGELGPGRMGARELPCLYRFRVADVPGGSKVYSVEIGSRDEYSFTRQEAEKGLSLTLGSPF